MNQEIEKGIEESMRPENMAKRPGLIAKILRAISSFCQKHGLKPKN